MNLLAIVLFATTFPHGRLPVERYSMFITLPACERGWGVDGTPDKPWTLVPGHTWADCFNFIVEIGLDGKVRWISDMALDDFMRGMPGLLLVEMGDEIGR